MDTEKPKQQPNYHATLEDAKRFIIWFVCNEPDVSDWDKTRYTNAITMIRTHNSRTPDPTN